MMICFHFLLSCSLGMFSLASCVLQHKSLGYKYIARVSEGFVEFSCLLSSSPWEGVELGGLCGTSSGDAGGTARCPAQPSVQQEAASPSRALLDFQMFIRAHGAVLALCTRGRGGFCSGEPVTSPVSGAQGSGGAGPLGQLTASQRALPWLIPGGPNGSRTCCCWPCRCSRQRATQRPCQDKPAW